MIEVKGVTKVYGRGSGSVTALDNVTFSISQGDFVSIIGPNGGGKSTLLLTIGGLLKPTTGTVNVAGSMIYDMSIAELAMMRLKKIGFMFQTFNLIPYLTALENVKVSLCLARIKRAEQTKIATMLLEKVGLGHRLKHKPSALSVGERQRVALARCLANNPSIILADEPTGSLDCAMSEEVINYFEDLYIDGMTIVMVTHNPRVLKSANRIFKIVQGRLSEVDRKDADFSLSKEI